MHLGFNGRLLIFVSNTDMVASAFVDHSARPPPSRKTRRVLSLAGNDRDTSNSIETSDAAVKKLGDRFFEKLAAVVPPTPKLAVLPRHRRTNEAWCGPRSWSRCCCISAVTHSAIRQASRSLAIEVHHRANARASSKIRWNSAIRRTSCWIRLRLQISTRRRIPTLAFPKG